MSHKQPLDTKCCFVLRASSVSEIDEPTCHKDEHLACSLGSPRPSGKRWPCASNSLFLLCIKMAKPLAFGFFLGGIVPLFGQTVRLRTVLGSMMSASHPRARRWVKIRWFNYTVWIWVSNVVSRGRAIFEVFSFPWDPPIGELRRQTRKSTWLVRSLKNVTWPHKLWWANAADIVLVHQWQQRLRVGK